MKKLKKWIALCLTLCCLMTLLPTTTVSAANGQKKLIALTFDDGPGPYTNRLLDGLAERNVHATFFVLGMRAEEYDETTRRIYAEGHQVAQHSYNHPTLTTQTDQEVRWQINHTKEILNDVLKQDFTYLVRPPYGDCNSRVLSLLEAPAIFWSIDPVDWRDRNAVTVRDRIVSNAYDGAIILCHDIYSTTVDGALMAIDTLKAEGYEFVTVNELFRRRGVTPQDGDRYSSCKPTGTQTEAVSAPTVSAELIDGRMKVKLTADPGAAIYYTLDGSEPAFYGTRYTEPFSYPAEATLKACAAYDLNGSRSETIAKKLDTLGIDPTVCVQDGKLVFTNQNENAGVYYTTDGTEPTTDSRCYTVPFACYDGVLRFCALGENVSTATQTIYVTAKGNLFWDVPNTSWYFHNVDTAVALGIFNGTGTYRFEPDTGLTRAMFVTTLYRLVKENGMDVSIKGTASFSDVPAGQWYTDAAMWASENGVVLGYEDGTFRPERSISREEMCAILDRLLMLLEVKTEGAPMSFADAGSISDWAKDSVARMSACGLIKGQGNNCFAPKATSTRAEAATVLLRIYDLIG